MNVPAAMSTSPSRPHPFALIPSETVKQPNSSITTKETRPRFPIAGNAYTHGGQPHLQAKSPFRGRACKTRHLVLPDAPSLLACSPETRSHPSSRRVSESLTRPARPSCTCHLTPAAPASPLPSFFPCSLLPSSPSNGRQGHRPLTRGSGHTPRISPRTALAPLEREGPAPSRMRSSLWSSN